MSKQRPRSGRRQPKGGSSHGYPRTARLSEVLREVIGDELTRIDDERLDLVTITAIDVDPEMNRAIVYFDSMFGEEGDEGVILALNEFRPRMQASINRQMHARKTPILSFRPDEVIRSAARIEELLRKKPDIAPNPSTDDEE
ncbi:MAG: 30S ribosome-binding factor RbfA [Actinobacteria bacterium]|nr:30S ribosome-binding factor RbfA [Actinomycetota bacterium]